MKFGTLLKNSFILSLSISAFLLFTLMTFLSSCKEESKLEYPQLVRELDPEKAASLSKKIREESAAELADGLELSLWASDSLVTDPIAISVDPSGRIFYTQATRIANSEFDIRGHQDWMTASISFETVEDRRAFLRKTFESENDASKKFLKDLNNDGTRDWRDLTVEKEQVWFVSDQSGDGYADRSQLYIEDFHEEITDLANGVEYSHGDVYISVGPDLWRTRDTNGDGIADKKESISHGFAVHIGFGAHGMSGVTMGPDGRIWWGIGDIGMNVIDKEGKHWKYPNRGVVVRSEPDGSNFEVFAMGVRNTHEFTFDKYGNLITEDNDGDHDGERERLVYLIDGSDTGWRINWQFGKYTDPDNNDYKVWMDEKMHIPRWEGQAAYFLPPIINYVNGPTGFVYNPGTALGPEWYDHFFVAEFRGTPSNSPIHAFTLKTNGASFALDQTKEIVKGLLPTGLDFGPDGALYFGDWINGWGAKNEGRIWKVDVPGGAQTALRQETKKWIETDFQKLEVSVLKELLAHQDMRIRTKAQFALVKRANNGYQALLETVQNNKNQLARIHGLWGMAQQARKKIKLGKEIVPFLTDQDAEIQSQAAKMIGDIKYKGATSELISLLVHPSPRVRFFATEALGRTEAKESVSAILKMLEQNNDEDTWLRMGGMIALGRIDEAKPLIALANSPSRALRTAAVVALRRMEHPGIAIFLKDQDEYVVAESARAIHDDYSIEGALPDLAKVLNEDRFKSEALIRRAISANLRLGQKENLTILKTYAMKASAPEDMRAEAILALSTWSKPSLHDRVDGRYRGVVIRDGTEVQKSFQEMTVQLFKSKESSILLAAMNAIQRLNIKSSAPGVFAVFNASAQEEIRAEALSTLLSIDATELSKAMPLALADKSDRVRARALEVLPKTAVIESEVLPLFEKIMSSGTVAEKQALLSSVSNFKGKLTVGFLSKYLDKLTAGKLTPEILLDLIEAIEKQGDTGLLERLKLYKSVQLAKDPMAEYNATLNGGNRSLGQQLFYNHEGAQCTRCHAIFEYGGNAGPLLDGVGTRLSKSLLLTSLIEPSQELALNYEVASLELKDGSSLTGIVTERNAKEIKLKMGKEDIRTIKRSDIAQIESMPSSMPGVKDILSKREIRDLMAFLESLKTRI